MEANTAAAVAEFKAMIDRFVAESLTDPDIIGRSDEFKAGYAQGCAEGLSGMLLQAARQAHSTKA